MRSGWMAISVAALALAAVSGYAQTTTTIRVTVPFEFTMDNQVMPAGDYSVGQNRAHGVTILTMEASDGQHTVYSLGSSISKGSAPDRSYLVFNRYGTSYYLADIWWGGFNAGAELPESKAERELTKSASLYQPAKVVLMASR